jgi:lon-related putative ATP-dependent protease
LVDNDGIKQAPVIFESNPTYYNLFGKLERAVEHGMYVTDFTKIKSGAIHRANGGFLVIEARDIFKAPYVWETLKRVLKNHRAYIETPEEHLAAMPATALRPQPIELDTKVILIGDEETYQYLLHLDDEFTKVFKIKADFDHKMERSAKTISAYSHFVAARCEKEGLMPFDNTALCAIVEQGSRLVEDQDHLSTEFGVIKDLVIEADFIARENKQRVVRRAHVEEALAQKYQRVNLYERHLQELVKNRSVLLSVTGKRVGQVNGLTVYDLGDHSFGRVCRITCTIAYGHGTVSNIDRAVKLSGRVHDKAVYILTHYLKAILGRQEELPFSASLTFEQSYGEVDGDSATSAELVALVSALADIPVLQNLAITGSLNQLGDVQPIGGVNEKIEGFYDTAQVLAKDHGVSVLIPHQNVKNLMLSQKVRSALSNKTLKIHPTKNFWEIFELATGVPFGITSLSDRTFAKNSALEKIAKKLKSLSALKSKHD